MARKRTELDEANRAEFCEPSRDGTTCARTCPADVRRMSKSSHVRLVRSVNSRGDDPPNAKPSTAGAGNGRSDSWTSINDRLDAIDCQIDTSRKRVPADVYRRVRQLEDRLLRLEAQSPEYSELYRLVDRGTSQQDRHKAVSASLVDRHSSNASLFSAHPYGRASRARFTQAVPASSRSSSPAVEDTDDIDSKISLLKETLRSKAQN